MTKRFPDFESWAAAECPPKPVPEEVPLPQFEDVITRWRNDAEEFEQQCARARLERKRNERRLASDEVDWATLLNALGDALVNIAKRLDDLEARVAKRKKRLPDAVPLDLPRFLAPKYGAALGYPEDVRFSQPLETQT